MDPEEDLEPAPPPGFASSYAVELLYPSPVSFDAVRVADRLAPRLPGATVTGQGSTLVVGHLAEPVEFSVGTAYPTTAIVVEVDGEPHNERFRDDLRQTWGFPGARDAVDATGATVLVTDALAHLLQPPRRLELFQGVLAAVVEVAPPLAIHWAPAGHLVDPAGWRRQLDDGDRLHGAVNVRLFRDGERRGELVMDTLGLAALGLPDVQCHFYDLDAGLMAGWLRAVAKHLFDNGPVLRDGATVSGFVPLSRWKVETEAAILPPHREVVDVDTGDGHAAGLRRRS